MTEPADEFRRFALSLYGGADVAQAALLLQDRCDADVNVLLLAAFVGAASGSSLSASDFHAARDHTKQWQLEVVSPLRALRQRLKHGLPPAPNPATAALRDRVKDIELDAELIELDELGGLTATFTGTATAGGAEQRALAAMLVVAEQSAGRELNRDERAALTVIASAAARLGKE